MSDIQKNSSLEVKNRVRQVFNEILLKCDESRVYGKYCEKLYGRDFRQYNQIPEEHLDKALKLLGLSSDDTCLDLACGNGRITEYISDKTGCSIYGIDIADRMISRAQERVQADAEKKGRIRFECRDLDDLAKIKEKFSVITAFDGIDLDRAVGQRLEAMLNLIEKNGQILILATADRLPIEPETIIEIENQTFAKLVRQKGLIFNFWDFTEDQKAFWNKSLNLLADLKDEFITEGSEDIYMDMLEDTEDMISALNEGLQRRYMVHVRL